MQCTKFLNKKFNITHRCVRYQSIYLYHETFFATRLKNILLCKIVYKDLELLTKISSVLKLEIKMLNTSAKLFLFVYAAYLVVNISSGCLWFVVTYNSSGSKYSKTI